MNCAASIWLYGAVLLTMKISSLVTGPVANMLGHIILLPVPQFSLPLPWAFSTGLPLKSQIIIVTSLITKCTIFNTEAILFHYKFHNSQGLLAFSDIHYDICSKEYCSIFPLCQKSCNFYI
jgi:hypothetical protein